MGVSGADRACRNCGAPLTGPYCAQCGQEDLPPDPTLRELLADAWDAFTSLDGKALRSARLLLLRPGALTTEYLAGRRASFVPPLRLYLVCSVLYFLASSALPEVKAAKNITLKKSAQSFADSLDEVEERENEERKDRAKGRAAAPRLTREQRRARDAALRDSQRVAILDSLHLPHAAGALDSARITLADSLLVERKVRREIGAHPGWFARTVTARFLRNAGKATKDTKSFGSSVKQQVPRMMFVLMPLFAALLMLAYRSRRRRFPTHLVVSLHLHALVFAALTVVALLDQVPSLAVRIAVGCAMFLWLLGYIPLALRRVYGGRLRWAVARAVFLTSIYATIGAFVFTGVALLMIVLYQGR